MARPDGMPDGACPELVEGLMHVSGKWIQQAVGVFLVKIFCRVRRSFMRRLGTSKISCAARIGLNERKFFNVSKSQHKLERLKCDLSPFLLLSVLFSAV